MISRNQVYPKIKIAVVFAGFFLLAAAITKGAGHNEIVLKVVGPDGKVLPGAKVYQNYSMQGDKQHGKEYICDNNGLVRLLADKVFPYEWQKDEQYIGNVLYGLYKEKLAGFAVLKGSDLDKEKELKL
jgi:hypothetical protein